MALSTTQSIWRSGGGDQTRTAYCGSGGLYAQFYIANSSATTANVAVSSTNNAAVILPAGAVVTSISITTGSTGANSTCNIGYTPLISVGPGQTTTLGTNVTGAFVSNANVVNRTSISLASTSGAGTQLGNVANATNLIVVTSAIGTAGAAGGPVTGIINYFVADPLNGVQNV